MCTSQLQCVIDRHTASCKRGGDARVRALVAADTGLCPFSRVDVRAEVPTDRPRCQSESAQSVPAENVRYGGSSCRLQTERKHFDPSTDGLSNGGRESATLALF